MALCFSKIHPKSNFWNHLYYCDLIQAINISHLNYCHRLPTCDEGVSFGHSFRRTDPTEKQKKVSLTWHTFNETPLLLETTTWFLPFLALSLCAFFLRVSPSLSQFVFLLSPSPQIPLPLFLSLLFYWTSRHEYSGKMLGVRLKVKCALLRSVTVKECNYDKVSLCFWPSAVSPIK